MKQKRNPAPVGQTGSGAKARKSIRNYSPVAALKQARIGHRCWPAWIHTPAVTGGEAWPKKPPRCRFAQAFLQRLLTSACKADSLRVLIRKGCVDLHLKPGLFLLHPAIEFAPSVGESVRPPEPFTALRTLGAFLFGGSRHE